MRFSVPNFELTVVRLLQAHEEVRCVKRLLEENPESVLHKRLAKASRERGMQLKELKLQLDRMVEE